MESEERRKAVLKDAHLRLLMELVGIRRLAPSELETLESSWGIEPDITADQLKESLDFINKAEFDPPVFDNDQSAADQLKRKAVPRKKADYDDDDDGDGIDDLIDDGEDEMLFPAGGPTARKSTALAELKQKRHRRRRAPREVTEEELDERAKARRQKELEKQRRIKSELYVNPSDDETDDERDRDFFAGEEAIRNSEIRPVMEFGESPKKKDKEGVKTTARRLLLDDSEDETPASTQDSSAAPARKRKLSVLDISSDEGSETEEERQIEKLAPRKRRAVFMDSSDDEDEDGSAPSSQPPHTGVGLANETEDEAMQTDDTPLSSSPHITEKVSEMVVSEHPASPGTHPGTQKSTTAAVGEAAIVDDDDGAPVAVVKRSRARAGFVVDSSDEE
jgi:replication fork protection complex subunit Tof1/Swi1